MRERLSACVPKDSELARESELSYRQLNGFNCLLRDQIGFWTDLCREKMPASRFLIQTDEFEFQELVRTSSLLCFTTDLANPQNLVPPGRIALPMIDPEVDVTYHLICRPSKKELVKSINV